MKNRRLRALSRITAVLLLAMVALLACLCMSGCKDKEESSEPATEATQATETETTEATTAPASKEPLATIFFTADYQQEEGFPSPADTLRGVLTSIKDDGRSPETFAFLGDFSNSRELHDYQISPEDAIAEIRDIVDESYGSGHSMVFVQGNHDKLTESIDSTGLKEYDDYLIYVLNTENDFPWKQGKVSGSLNKVKEASKEMKSCFDELIEKGETRPLFVTGHVPLHFTARTSSWHSTGDNLYSSLIFDVVNEAGKSLDIVYLFGHDHSKGWDCYLGGASVFKAPGESLLIPKFDEKKVNTDEFTEENLNFTYLNAGYSGYYMNCGPDELEAGRLEEYRAADDTLSGTVCRIWPDRLELARYSAEGLHPLSWEGEGDPYKGNIDQGLIPEEYYSQRIDSPQSIDRK